MKSLFLLGTALLLCSCGPVGTKTWNDSSYRNESAYQKLRECYDGDLHRELLQAARDTIFQVWDDGKMPPVPPMGTGEGLAIRLLAEGKDRGCLAWYKNTGDRKLFVQYCAAQALWDYRYEPLHPKEAENVLLELDVFGEWEDMNSPEDFIPAFHNLWLIDGVENTILQASLVSQRNYTKEKFLEVICVKALLDKNAWKENTGLRWKRSPALWYTEPLQL